MSDLSTPRDWKTLNVSLNASYQEVKVGTNVIFRGFRVQSRGESNILHKKLTGDTDYITIKGGISMPYTILGYFENGSLGFFATESGTEVAEITIFY